MLHDRHTALNWANNACACGTARCDAQASPEGDCDNDGLVNYKEFMFKDPIPL